MINSVVLVLSIAVGTCQSLAYSVVSDSLRPHGLEPARLLCGDSQARMLEWVAVSSSRTCQYG